MWWESLSVCPTLKKVAKAALSIFHGPQIESSFSTMKDILDMNTGSMAIETYSAYQTVKYFLNSTGSSAVKHFRRPDVKHTAVSSTLVKNLQASRHAYHTNLKEKREKFDTEMSALSLTKKQLQTAAAAKRSKEKAVMTTFRKHQKCLKRPHQCSSVEASKAKRKKM